MVTLVAQKAVNFEINPLTGLDLIKDPTTTYSNKTNEGFTATNGNIEVHFAGSGFTYEASGKPNHVDGTISSIAVKTDGDPAYSLTNVDVSYDSFTQGIGFDGLDTSLQLNNRSDSLTGSPFADKLYGFGTDDVLRGRGGSDLLDGGDGNDRLVGGTGNDVLKGSYGNDTLVGGAGKDKLEGGWDHDIFRFNTRFDSVTGANRDVILDFVHGDDVIDLHIMDANVHAVGNQSFHFIGAKSFQAFAEAHPAAHGLLRYANGIVSGDVNGDLHADFSIAVAGGIPALHASDFVL
jgi:serralysin